MTDVEILEKNDKKKKAQAAAHRKWRESEKGKAYYQRLKERKIRAGLPA